jgi:hypothetical protein
VLPSVVPAPSASASAAPAPSIPAEASAATAQGAAAFARYYMAVVGRAFETADAGPMRNLSAAGCGGCEALASSVDSLRDKRQRRTGGNYVIRSAVAPEVAGGDVVVDLEYERTPARILDVAGNMVEEGPAVPLTPAQMRLLWRGDSWVVQGYRVVGPK